jgi:AcrR family transcriptional regulator
MDSPTYNSPRQADRRMRIMRIAREYLIVRDRADWTMTDLARDAGVARKTLYNIYSSKQEIMRAAALETIAEIGFGTAEHSEPGIPAIIEFTDRTIFQIEQTPEFARNIGRTALEASEKNELTDFMLGNTIPFLSQHISIANKANEMIPNCRPERLAETIAVQSWGQILFWFHGQFPLDELGPRTRFSLLAILAGCTSGKRHEQLIDALSSFSIHDN